MKTILTIGYNHFVLPASVNVNAILAALQKAQRVESKLHKNRIIYIRDDGDPRIEVKLVDDDMVLDSKKLKQLPERASPDAHNTFGS